MSHPAIVAVGVAVVDGTPPYQSQKALLFVRPRALEAAKTSSPLL